MRQPVVLDTDIGTDIDDAYALVLAASSPEIDLRAVTTVNHDVVLRGRIALALLQAMGRRDVPVSLGARTPLTPGETRGWAGHEGRGISLAPLEGVGPFDPRDAASVMAEEARRAHDAGTSLTIVPIGAMTNVAIAIERYPEAMRLAGRVVAMASTFAGYGPSCARPEHNVACDPVAVQTVLDFGLPLTFIGLNVTMQTRLCADDVDRFSALGGRLAAGLCGMHRVWLQTIGSQGSAMHDPLALAVVYRPGLVDLLEVQARVLLDAAEPGSIEYNPADGGSVTHIAANVDAEAFHSLLRDRVTHAIKQSRESEADADR